MVVALTMGRKGSKGFPRKNIYPVLGKPLAYYSMKAAKDCHAIDKVYISTDDEKLIKLAKELNVESIIRPAKLCTDAALGENVYLHGFNAIKELNKENSIEIIVLLMCNAPCVTAKMIAEGIDILHKNPAYDSCVSVSRYNMWSPLRARKTDGEGLLRPFVFFEAPGDKKTLSCDRDSQGDVWFADMGVSIIRPRCLEHIKDGLLPQKWMGKRIYPLKQWGGLDVDYEWQIPQVEYWLRKNLNVDKKKGSK